MLMVKMTHTAGLDMLLFEIDRQLQVLSERESNTNATSPINCVTILSEEDDGYRNGLLGLRKTVFELCGGLTSGPKDHRPSAEIANCVWKFTTYSSPPFALIEPATMIESVTTMSKVRRHGNDRHDSTLHIWANTNLLTWASQESSSIIIIQGSSQSIQGLRDFSCEIVHRILLQNCVNAYILNSADTREYFKRLDTIELLRQLACQLLRAIAIDMPTSLLIEVLHCFLYASTANDWFNVFRTLLRTRMSAFIVIDASVLQERANVADIWVQEFKNLFDMLTRTSTVCIKVMILSSRKVVDGPIQSHSPSIVVDATETFPEGFSRLRRSVRCTSQSLSFFIPPHTPNNQPSLPGVKYLEETAESNTCLGFNSEADQQQMVQDSVREQDGSSQQSNIMLASSKAPSASFILSGALELQRQRQPHRRNEIEIAIFCALPLEADAIRFLCDELYDYHDFGKVSGDSNFYDVVRFGGHTAAIINMAGPGKINAATSAANCRHSFPNIRLALLAGICGGIPSTYTNSEILLGDIVISDRLEAHDFGKRVPGGFQSKNTTIDKPRKPLPEIAGFLRRLESQSGRKELSTRMGDHLNSLRQDIQHGEWASYPGVSSDVVFEPTYNHKHHRGECNECGSSPDSVCKAAHDAHCVLLGCDVQRTISRKRHPAITENQGDYQVLDPVVHIGAYASGDTVMKSGKDRDDIGLHHQAIALEMEGLGIWDVMPTIIVKGVCDYADSHKNKVWQKYAAAAAAACVKSLLEVWQ